MNQEEKSNPKNLQLIIGDFNLVRMSQGNKEFWWITKGHIYVASPALGRCNFFIRQKCSDVVFQVSSLIWPGKDWTGWKTWRRRQPNRKSQRSFSWLIFIILLKSMKSIFALKVKIKCVFENTVAACLSPDCSISKLITSLLMYEW